MRVLKVVAEGLVTSFRYPHFMQEVQPTYEMPPPATLYGHICSALGEWFDPEGIRFAVRFTFQTKFEDLEHIHQASTKRGDWPKRGDMKRLGWNYPIAVGGSVTPFHRELLFHPRLVLYLNRPEWVDAFRHPRYPVILGRSQDLFTYTSVEVVELEQATNAYFEHTLAPYSFARRTAQGIVVLMPRFLDYHRNRHPTFGRYVVLHRRVHSRDFLRFAGEPEMQFWTDPTAPKVNGDPLGLVFHTWVGDDDSTLRLA